MKNSTPALDVFALAALLLSAPGGHKRWPLAPVGERRDTVVLRLA